MIKKVSIIGAGGVGSSVAYNLLNFLKLKEIVLIDINTDLAKGVAFDLEDTRGILNFSTKITGSSHYGSIKESDIIVITAGVARKEGMTRLDLLKINSKITKDISQKIKKFAPDSIIIVVTNPLDIITYVVEKETKFSRNKVIGMGSSLDTSRLLNIIFNESQISVSSVDAMAWGPHSKNMFVDSAKARVSGRALSEILNKGVIKKINQEVAQRGAKIVGSLKTKSAQFAPGLACARLIKAIADNENKIIPVSVVLKGEYGLKGLSIGLPCMIGSGGIKKIIEIPLTKNNKKEITKIKESLKNV